MLATYKLKTVWKRMFLYKWPLYNLFWPFFCHMCVYLPQNWGSDSHLEVLNGSKSWLGQKCLRARPLGDLQGAIATSQLCPKYFPFTYLFYQDFKVEMAKVCLITKKIVQFSLHSILYCRSLMQRLVYPWSMIWNTYLNFHDW